MSSLAPVTRREFIARLRRLGFRGPYAGAKHEFMVRGDLRLRVPNPHRRDIGVPLLTRILKQAGISPEEWTRA
jgi:predicted RNA binding protein YcfA (HicA-like mRNA interferase family)